MSGVSFAEVDYTPRTIKYYMSFSAGKRVFCLAALGFNVENIE